MPRLNSIDLLPQEKRLRVDTVLREHGYAQFSQVVTVLSIEGIHLSRAALHRYAKSLRDRDGMFAGSPDRTIVVLLDKQTGGVTTFTTSIDANRVAEVIGKLTLPSQP